MNPNWSEIYCIQHNRKGSSKWMTFLYQVFCQGDKHKIWNDLSNKKRDITRPKREKRIFFASLTGPSSDSPASKVLENETPFARVSTLLYSFMMQHLRQILDLNFTKCISQASGFNWGVIFSFDEWSAREKTEQRNETSLKW